MWRALYAVVDSCNNKHLRVRSYCRRVVNGLQVLIAKGRKQKRRNALAGNYGRSWEPSIRSPVLTPTPKHVTVGICPSNNRFQA